MNTRPGILIVSVTILVLCFVGTASATTWSVDGSGGDADFTGIQDAINKATDGDTILVHFGVYYENVVVNKSVTLIGTGQPVVDASGTGSAITLTADGITLEGFTATNSGSSWQDKDAGIKVISNNNIITGNNVNNNDWGGISLDDSNNNSITGNNACNNDWGGISLDDSCNNNNITSNNVCSNGFGISLDDSCNNKITGNNASNNNQEGIFLYDSSNNNKITGNNASNNNYGGIHLSYSSNNTLTGNNVGDNNDGGISLGSSCSNTTITGNVFVNDGLSVYSSYQNTVEGNTVNGKPLVYLEDASDYRVEDAGQVILVNCSNILVENLDLSNTRIGVELLNTKDSNILNNNVSNNGWEGIYLSDSCNNKITGNNASNNKEGIDLYSSSNNNTITGNNVCNNNYGGISLWDSSDNTIYFNNFIDNPLELDRRNNLRLRRNNLRELLRQLLG
jgi:parallel beta-helix repeat protein